ncbi:MAG TPA: DUF3052 family protein [Planctomycetota bacterium]|nr:DUF3052 family protein [Planctomycetota bacterium]
MTRVHLVHWNEAEGAERAKVLRGAGREVSVAPFTPESWSGLRKHPPDAIVVDLSRRPAQGRVVGFVLRQSKATRHVPLVFVGGEPEKVAPAKKRLPDATFTEWARVRGALRAAIARGADDPIVPVSTSGAYSGTPLPKKLGIREGARVALDGAPPGFEATLGSLPDGARVQRRSSGARDLTIWFARSQKDLARRMARMAAHAEGGRLWILWPKQGAKASSDVTQYALRELALAAGLVDFKVCAVDETWSGFRFSRKR